MSEHWWGGGGLPDSAKSCGKGWHTAVEAVRQRLCRSVYAQLCWCPNGDWGQSQGWGSGTVEGCHGVLHRQRIVVGRASVHEKGVYPIPTAKMAEPGPRHPWGMRRWCRWGDGWSV